MITGEIRNKIDAIWGNYKVDFFDTSRKNIDQHTASHSKTWDYPTIQL